MNVIETPQKDVATDPFSATYDALVDFHNAQVDFRYQRADKEKPLQALATLVAAAHENESVFNALESFSEGADKALATSASLVLATMRELSAPHLRVVG